AGDGPLYEHLGRAILWTDASDWIDGLTLPEPEPGTARILLAGSLPPDDRLHRAAETAGGSIVAEALPLGSLRCGPELELGTEPASTALAAHLRAASRAPRAFFDRPAWVVERARAARAAGVVVWLTREDEALAWSAPAIERALAAAGLPSLLLVARRWQADDDTAERVAAFVARCSNASA
ncbi:MAG: hypothetical protein R3305_12180, partial [Gammaproteobacteria bacterium]|nr:hypothetical protein [Gammaproteobacteria bacterium]